MKYVLDLDDRELPPLRIWLQMLRIVRIRHEVTRDGNINQAAIRLDVSRFTIYRALRDDADRAERVLKINR